MAIKTNEHICSEKMTAEGMQSGYLVEWSILQWGGKWYLNANHEYEIPVRGCPFCRSKLIEGLDTALIEKVR